MTALAEQLRVGYVASWKNRLRSRIYQEFKETNVEDFSDAWAEQCQAIEDALQSITSITSIDDSVGAQLRNIGRIVGQPSMGEDDDTYRLRVKARIRVNLSSGNPEDLYPIFRAMLAVGAGHARVVKLVGDVAAFLFSDLDVPLDPVVAGILFGMLLDGSEDGVKMVLTWPSASGAGSFAFDGGDGLGWGDATDITVGGALAGALTS